MALRDRDVPRAVLIPEVQPVLNILDVASRPVAGTATVAAAPAVAQLPDVPGALVLVQADPGNAGNTLVGFGNANIPIVLAPGATFEASIPNLDLVFFGSSGAFPVTVNWVVLQPV